VTFWQVFALAALVVWGFLGALAMNMAKAYLLKSKEQDPLPLPPPAPYTNKELAQFTRRELMDKLKHIHVHIDTQADQAKDLMRVLNKRLGALEDFRTDITPAVHSLLERAKSTEEEADHYGRVMVHTFGRKMAHAFLDETEDRAKAPTDVTKYMEKD